MIGITIGIGAEWAALAHTTARRMAHTTGLECHVIDADDFGCVHPSWLKCHVHRLFPDEDSFLIFDADILPLRPWDPAGLFRQLGRPFMAVPEPNSNGDLVRECQEWQLGFPDVYLNCGLLIFGHEHGFVLDRTWTRHPHGGRWLEQTAINRSLADEAVEICRLPRHFNVMAQCGRLHTLYARSTLASAVNVHTCAMDDPAAITLVHQQILDYVASGKAGATREDLLFDLLTHFGPGSTGAELGVFCGDFSRDILRIVQPARLHLVDLFHGRETSCNVNGQNMRTVHMPTIKAELDLLPHVTTHASDSVAWLQAQPTASLDWLYIDTTHLLHHTAAELHEAHRVVRPGGLITGHDFSRAFPGVVQAVRDFTATHNLPLRIYDGDLLPSFAIKV
jgi:SAM-dependent methyltransferase